MTAMTELLSRPTTPRQRPNAAPPGSPATVSAVAAGAVAAGAGLLVVGVVVVTTWAASFRGAGAADALRAVVDVWLIAHRVSLTIVSGGVKGHVALLPMGLLALPAYAVFRAGRWFAHTTGVDDVRGVMSGGLTLGGAYGFVAAVLASAAASGAIHPAAGQALLAGCCVGMLFGTLGIAHETGFLREWWLVLPGRTRATAHAAAVGVAVVLGAGLLMTVGATLLHLGRVTSLGSALGPGAVGGTALGLACLAYLPNAVVWSASYAVGPGFAVGAHTSVSPLAVHLGAVPSFPLLGALPGSGAAPALSLPFVAAPIAAGAVIGVLVIRRAPTLRIEDAALSGFAAGAVGGLALGMLAALSGGPAGPGRMATVGPSAWQVGLAAVLELGIAAAVAAAEVQRRLLR